MENFVQGVVIAAVGIICAILGAFIYGFFRGALISRRQRISERKALRIESEARIQGKRIVDESKIEADKLRNNAENEYRQRRGEIQRQENRLTQKIDSLDRKLENLEHRDRSLNNREKEIETLRSNVAEIREKAA
jgi:ribonuclease Y